jgi:hypothetical protein
MKAQIMEMLAGPPPPPPPPPPVVHHKALPKHKHGTWRPKIVERSDDQSNCAKQPAAKPGEETEGGKPLIEWLLKEGVLKNNADKDWSAEEGNHKGKATPKEKRIKKSKEFGKYKDTMATSLDDTDRPNLRTALTSAPTPTRSHLGGGTCRWADVDDETSEAELDCQDEVVGPFQHAVGAETEKWAWPTDRKGLPLKRMVDGVMSSACWVDMDYDESWDDSQCPTDVTRSLGSKSTLDSSHIPECLPSPSTTCGTVISTARSSLVEVEHQESSNVGWTSQISSTTSNEDVPEKCNDASVGSKKKIQNKQLTREQFDRTKDGVKNEPCMDHVALNLRPLDERSASLASPWLLSTSNGHSCRADPQQLRGAPLQIPQQIRGAQPQIPQQLQAHPQILSSNPAQYIACGGCTLQSSR